MEIVSLRCIKKDQEFKYHNSICPAKFVSVLSK